MSERSSATPPSTPSSTPSSSPSSTPPPRPQQVTTAAVLAGTACLLLVANLFSARDQLRGGDLRDTLDEAFGSSGLVSTERVVDVLHVLVFVSGALAAVAFVLVIYAWQHNRMAWIGFFVSVGLLVLSMPVAGVLPLLLLLFATGFLASRPVRTWFRSESAQPAGVLLTEEGQRPNLDKGQPPYGQPAFGQPQQGQPPYGQPQQGQPPYGQPQQGSYGQPPFGQPQGQTPYGGPQYGGASPYGQPQQGPYSGSPLYSPPSPYGGRDPDQRPGTVTAAAILTWIGAGLVAALLALVAIGLASDSSSVVRGVRDRFNQSNIDVTRDQILSVAWTVTGVGLFWCLSAILLAVAAFRRSKVGRIGLLISAVVTALLSLLLILSGISVLTLALGVAVAVLLVTGGANDWYARRGSGSSFGQPPGQQFQPPSQPSSQSSRQSSAPPDQGRQGPW